MKVVGIVQARMGSSRLPGKVLLNILDKPMLWHLINRVKGSKKIDDIVIAATISPEDEAITKFGIEYDINTYRGSVDDIADRFYNAAKLHNADMIVRIWGDCPLIDPQLIDEALKTFQEAGADYLNNFNPPTYPVGMNLEIYRFGILEKIMNETEDPFYREYPFEFVYKHKNELKSVFVSSDVDRSSINLTVDYREDLELVAAMFEKLYEPEKIFHLDSILKFIDSRPQMLNINKGLKRNIEYKRDLKNREKSDKNN